MSLGFKEDYENIGRSRRHGFAYSPATADQAKAELVGRDLKHTIRD
jgi:hypothetical protein